MPGVREIDDLGGAIDDGFPAHLARELQATSVQLLPRGTSPARVWRAATPYGPLAVKVMRRGAGIADGQDLGSFLREPAQLQRVRQEVPALGPFVVDVVGVWQHAGWAAYAMPYVEGSPVVSPGSAPPDARDRLARVFRVLTEHGYARTRHSSSVTLRPPDLAQIRRRLWILRRHLPAHLLDGRAVVVNGRACRPLEPLLQAIERDPALLARIRPGVVSYPVHGELDLADMLAPERSGTFTLIDPRGTRGYHDPVEDFARALLSMTTLDRTMASGTRTWFTPARDGRPPEYVLRSVDPNAGYPRLGEWFVGMLGELPFGHELNRVDPHWRVRLAFSHGFHALLEATARLSDRSPEPEGPSAPRALTLATTFCALGLRLLDQALAGAARSATALPDVSTGLDDDTGVLWRYGAGGPAAGRHGDRPRGRSRLWR